MTMTMTKTHTKTNTETKTKTMTKTKTKCLKDPSHAIFSKRREFKDIRYDAYNDKDNDKDKDTDTDKDKDKSAEKTQHILYFKKSRGYKDIKYDILTTQLVVPFAPTSTSYPSPPLFFLSCTQNVVLTSAKKGSSCPNWGVANSGNA